MELAITVAAGLGILFGLIAGVFAGLHLARWGNQPEPYPIPEHYTGTERITAAPPHSAAGRRR